MALTAPPLTSALPTPAADLASARAGSVLDLDAFERNTKAEGLGVGSEGAAGEKNMHDDVFTCAVFRFLQLTCEGHNLGTGRGYRGGIRLHGYRFTLSSVIFHHFFVVLVF